MVLFVLQLDSPETAFDISCVLWTGSFWWLVRAGKSPHWFRGEIWPMYKVKHNGGKKLAMSANAPESWGCCSTAMCQMTVSESRTTAFSVF